MALPKNIKAILFDCDNTLVMSEPRAFEGCAAVVNSICKKKGVPLEKEFTGHTLLQKFVGMNFRGMLNKLKEDHDFKISPEEEEEFVLEEMYRVMDKIRAELEICGGVDKQLDDLQALNKPVFDKRQTELEAINEELAAEKKDNEPKIEEWKKKVEEWEKDVEQWEKAVAAWEKKLEEWVTKGKEGESAPTKPPKPTKPTKPDWVATKKEKFDELQKELDSFKSGVDESKLPYDLRKEENWKLEAMHKFNTQATAYNKQEEQDAAEEAREKDFEEKKGAKAVKNAEAKKKGETVEEEKEEKYVPSLPKYGIPVQYREKEIVRPTSLEASTPLLLVVVSSSAKARVEVSIEAGNMLKYFGTRIYSAATSLPQGPTSKPNPAVYQYAMEQFGVKPEECIAVEDSVSGATAGRSADIPTIGYVWPYTKEKPDKSEEMAVKLTELTRFKTDPPVKTGCNVIMRNWSEFPELLKELDDAAGKPKASI